MHTTFRAVLVLVLTLAFAASPLVVDDFAGYDTTAFPVPMAEPPMQPAGWAFGIWGVIYAWLVVMGAFGVFRRRDDPGWDATRSPLSVSLLVGSVWLFVAVDAPILATGLIWLMLATAVVALVRTPRRDRWALRGAIALYAGWLTAAASVSLGLIAAGHGVLDLSPEVWAYATLSITGLVAVPVILARPSIPYVAAIVWALAGIAAALPPVAVIGCAAFGAVALVVLLATQARRLFAPNPPEAKRRVRPA